MFKNIILFLIISCLAVSIENDYIGYVLLETNECNYIPEKLTKEVKEENIFYDENRSHYTVEQITLETSEETHLFLSVHNSQGFFIIKLPLYGKDIYKTNLNINFFHPRRQQDYPDAKIYLIEEKELVYLLIENIVLNGKIINMNWILNNENLHEESIYSMYCFKKLGNSNKNKYKKELLEKLPENEWIKLNSNIMDFIYHTPIIRSK